MSDNPLDVTPERQARIDARAKSLWEADGKPDGSMDDYQERADELVRMELAGNPGQKPVDDGSPIPGVVVEEASIQQNLGEFPGGMGFADQGEWRETPMTREEMDANGDAGVDRGGAP